MSNPEETADEAAAGSTGYPAETTAEAQHMAAAVGYPPDVEVPSASVITARLREHLAKVHGGACMFCGGTHWNPYAWAQLLIFSGPANDAPLVKTFPALHLECAGCGLVVTMNANAAGIVRAEQPAVVPAAE